MVYLYRSRIFLFLAGNDFIKATPRLFLGNVELVCLRVTNGVVISHYKTIYGNTVRFASYPSSIKPAYNTEDVLKFPRGKTSTFLSKTVLKCGFK